jgi:hypothetical protein
MANWEAIHLRFHLFRYSLKLYRISKLCSMEWVVVRLWWMLRPGLNAWETVCLYRLYSIPTCVSWYKFNTSSQMYLPRFEPGTYQVAIRILYLCVNTLGLFMWRRFKCNVLFKFDGNCFFLAPSGQPFLSIIALITPGFGVHELESLSQGWLALLFSLFYLSSLQPNCGIVLQVGLRVFCASLFEFRYFSDGFFSKLFNVILSY